MNGVLVSDDDWLVFYRRLIGATVMETNTTGGWKETTTRMREQINETLQNTKNEYINPQKLKRYFRHNIEKTSEGKTKIQFLRENTNWKAGERVCRITGTEHNIRNGHA